jgi:putative copper resistance protein D
MMEIINTLFHWLQLASNMLLIGGYVFLAMAVCERTAFENPWLVRLERALPWMAVTLLLGLLGLLATTTAQVTGAAENVWRPGAWLELVQQRRIGFIWSVRGALALVMCGMVFSIRSSARAPWRYLLGAAVAALTLVMGSLARHSMAEVPMTTVLSHALHLVLASLWVGGVPAVLTVLFAATKAQSAENADWSGVQTLKRFSVMALPLMVAVFATGLIVAYRTADPNYAALFVTNYGWLLNAKLGLLVVVLVIAVCTHVVWLPALGQNAEVAAVAGRRLRRWVAVEVVLAFALVLAATLLANAIPPKHAVIHEWPYPFRFSITHTWGMGMPSVMIRVWVGIVVLVLAGGMVAIGRTKRWEPKWRRTIPTALTACALVVALPALTVPAYLETYRKTPVPFNASSIANGMSLFGGNCVPCHGPQGKGNGVLAKTFAKPPVDLLTEPHTSMHTPGDFFHWLTYGIPGTGMPAWGEKFSEEDRWDLVNFIHATSRGYQARLIRPRVLTDQPYSAPQNFSYSAHDGTSGTSKDFRRQKAVLLVVFSWPESRERLDQLRLAYPAVSDRKAEVLAVPMTHLNPQEISAITEDLPFAMVTEGAMEISRSYSLFRRTIANPDLYGEGTVPKHMEFLVDRYGYLRARWIPEADGAGWTDIGLLTQQIDQLNQEKEILPPPADYVHDASSGMSGMSGMKDMDDMKNMNDMKDMHDMKDMDNMKDMDDMKDMNGMSGMGMSPP